jgi:hypothetical protein
MDISQYAASAESIGALSQYQIHNFFRRHTSVTRNGCDQTAAEIIGCSVSATPVQGVGSYTVAGGTKVVPFRHSELDLQVMNRARIVTASLSLAVSPMGDWAMCMCTRWTWSLVFPFARLDGSSSPQRWNCV